MLTAYEFLSSSSSIIDDARRQILGGEKKARLGLVLLYKKCKPIVAENVGFSGFVFRAKIVLLFP